MPLTHHDWFTRDGDGWEQVRRVRSSLRCSRLHLGYRAEMATADNCSSVVVVPSRLRRVTAWR